MRSFEEGKKRIQAICESIREEAIAPAAEEAQRLIDEGERLKQELIAEGKREKERLVREGQQQIEQARAIFESSLAQGARQAVELLKQKLEKDFFNNELKNLINGTMSDPSVIAQVIEVLVKAIDREGLGANLSVAIANDVKPELVNRLLAKHLLERLENGSVTVGDFVGGAKVSLRDGNMSVELTLDDVKKLFADNLRKDFRKLIFS